MKKIKSLWRKAVNGVKDYFRYWTVRKVMKGISRKDPNRKVYEILLYNVEQASRASASLLPNQKTNKAYKKQLMRELTITRKVIDKVLPLGELIGIQPMSTPTGLVYKLRYSKNDKDETTLIVKQSPVAAASRKYEAIWNIEATQDLMTVHGINFEDELVEVLAAEMVESIVNEQINNLCELAKQNQQYEVTPPENQPFISDTLSKLLVTFNLASNNIAQTTRRGAGNVIVTSPIGLSMLQTQTHMRFEPNKKEILSTFTHAGDLKVGDNVMYSVFVTLAPALMNALNTRFLVLYKGKSGACDAGYFWAPYVLLHSTGVVISAETFQPQIQFLARYGQDTDDVSHYFYRLVEIDPKIVYGVPQEDASNGEGN